MKQCAIVIPIYKEEISYYESISLKQCFAILHNHPILFICPVKLKDTKLHEENKAKSEFIFVDNNNFDSIIAYNKMLMSVWFYELFVKFDSVLIYQLDCFVFKDELNSWIEKGFSSSPKQKVHHFFDEIRFEPSSPIQARYFLSPFCLFSASRFANPTTLA